MPLQLDVSFVRGAQLRSLRAAYGASLLIGVLGATFLGTMALDLAQRPQGPGASLLLLWALAGLVLCLPVVLVHLISEPLRRVLASVEREKLIFSADRTGLHLPALLLTDPAFSLLAQAGEKSLFLPWAEIEHWEVRGARGDLGPQHFIKVIGDCAQYGQAAPGGTPIWREPGFGIARGPLQSIERELLDMARAHVASGVHREIRVWWNAAS